MHPKPAGQLQSTNNGVSLVFARNEDLKHTCVADYLRGNLRLAL
jgi:hypothetical protein